MRAPEASKQTVSKTVSTNLEQLVEAIQTIEPHRYIVSALA
jgi:hypothetical protein